MQAPQTNAWAVEPGSVRLRPTGTNAESDNFDGPLDPAKWKATPWDTTGTTPGDAAVSGGTLIVDGRHVNDPGDAPATTMVPTASSPLVLSFRATFGGEVFQHIGFGNTLAGTVRGRSSAAATVRLGRSAFGRGSRTALQSLRSTPTR